MAIKDDYLSYLRHFRRTVPLAELHRRRSKNIIGLRHDVDYDLDLALELAYHEKVRGFRATYFLLHTAAYWSDPRLVEKALQLQDFGHEVGLHVDLLSVWYAGEAEEPARLLEELLNLLRAGGVAVRGVAAHGSKSCYRSGFINYWCFAELRPSDPRATEDGRTAEGPMAADPAFRIRYPPDHAIRRGDGASHRLWSVSMAAAGIDYHAFHLPYDRYFTDSGGSWRRSPDPLDVDLSAGRSQVLMHPIYWRGPPRLYFFLSTARSGSKWLAKYLDRATNLTARHEFALNHRFRDGTLVPEKRTAHHFAQLVAEPAETRQLLLEARALMEDTPGDQAEVNVYLAHFLPGLREVFPDAVFVHLHRDPRDVVRSIINRDWYDTPEDERHPVPDVEGWDQLSQFAKACWYVRTANESLIGLTPHRLAFEKMTRSERYLNRRLAELGLAVFPRLGRAVHGEVLNANANGGFPETSRWPSALTATWRGICAPVSRRLGYDRRWHRWWRLLRAKLSGSTPSHLQEDGTMQRALSQQYRQPATNLVDSPLDETFLDRLSAHACTLEAPGDGIELRPEGTRHAHVLFGGGEWRQVGEGGWPVSLACYYRGELGLEMRGESARGSIFCLQYDERGELSSRRLLLTLGGEARRAKFSFRVRSDVARFNIAFYLSVASLPERVVLERFRLERIPLKAPEVSAA